MYKIAIIDDDPDIVEAITLLLKSNGYKVVTAGNINDAQSLVDTENPDLIILDVMMEEPDDGFYLANKFRKKGIVTPIIMLTSISKVTGYNFGKTAIVPIEEFIEKPVKPNLLLEKVEYYIKNTEVK